MRSVQGHFSSRSFYDGVAVPSKYDPKDLHHLSFIFQHQDREPGWPRANRLKPWLAMEHPLKAEYGPPNLNKKEAVGMMKSEVFERRCAELKQRLRSNDGGVIRFPAPVEPRTYNLRQAAQRLGVSYSTARRLLDTDPDVRRYSTATGEPVFPGPGTPLKRFQRVRLTWVIPESSIERLILQMQGQWSNAA